MSSSILKNPIFYVRDAISPVLVVQFWRSSTRWKAYDIGHFSLLYVKNPRNYLENKKSSSKQRKADLPRPPPTPGTSTNILSLVQ